MRSQLLTHSSIVLAALAAHLPAQGTAEHVVQVSVDGLNATLLQDLLDNDVTNELDNFRRFFLEGATTMNARTDHGRTNTLPNHVCMVTGRPVFQPAAQPNTVHHGWATNSDPASSDTLHNAGNPNLSYIASSFDVAHDHGLSVGFFASKSKFILFEQSYDAGAGAPDTTGADDGMDKIDMYREQLLIHPLFLAEFAAQEFDYVFLHYRDPDSAGHNFGWGSTEYDDAIRLVDDWLGELFAVIESDPGLNGATVVLLTTDHGGVGTSHGNVSNPENYTIPFFAWGPGIAPGSDLYALNAGRRLDPGTGRPDYDAPLQPIRNGEAGNLALDLLGLPAIPGSTVNSLQDLAVGHESFSASYGCGVNPDGSLAVLSGSFRIGGAVELGVDNPLGTQAPGSVPMILLSTAPDGAYPCGTLFPGLGMNGPGELLVDVVPPAWVPPVVMGPAWGGPGQPAPVAMAIPPSPVLAGAGFFLQGLLYDATAPLGTRIGLTNALEVTVGN